MDIHYTYLNIYTLIIILYRLGISYPYILYPINILYRVYT